MMTVVPCPFCRDPIDVSSLINGSVALHTCGAELLIRHRQTESFALLQRGPHASLNTCIALYADGGVIGSNPSLRGGTWAWCQVNAAGQRSCTNSGMITPDVAQMPAISNNLTELLALVEGLESLPEGWQGTIYSDSWVSLQRVFRHARLKNVPDWLVARLQALQKRGHLYQYGYTLLDGHPTKAELAVGRGKRGHPVSEHNVWCDQECNRLARAAQQNGGYP